MVQSNLETVYFPIFFINLVEKGIRVLISVHSKKKSNKIQLLLCRYIDISPKIIYYGNTYKNCANIFQKPLFMNLVVYRFFLSSKYRRNKSQQTTTTNSNFFITALFQIHHLAILVSVFFSIYFLTFFNFYLNIST